MPVISTWEIDGTPISCRPLRKTPTISAPTQRAEDVPRPPNRLVPPSTTAVMLSRLSVWPALRIADARCGRPSSSAAMP